MGVNKKAVPINRDGKGKVQIILQAMQLNQPFSFAFFIRSFNSYIGD
jgi:hypothetical protein